jgi:hypothetical protein
VLDWGKQQRERPVSRKRKSKDVELLCRVLAETVKKHGFAFQPDPGGPAEQACHGSKLQAAFYERRLAEGTARQQRDKRWRAYTRALRAATEVGLVGVREIDSDRVLWARG